MRRFIIRRAANVKCILCSWTVELFISKCSKKFISFALFTLTFLYLKLMSNRKHMLLRCMFVKNHYELNIERGGDKEKLLLKGEKCGALSWAKHAKLSTSLVHCKSTTNMTTINRSLVHIIACILYASAVSLGRISWWKHCTIQTISGTHNWHEDESNEMQRGHEQ